MPMKCLKQNGPCGRFSHRRNPQALNRMLLSTKQTSNYLSCFLWETQHPTTHGDDSCEFFGGLHHSKEIHSYFSQQMYILFSWTENKLYVFVQVYFPFSTLPLLFFKNEYRICNSGRQQERLNGGCHWLVSGEQTGFRKHLECL